jgi:hypothetical protein
VTQASGTQCLGGTQLIGLCFFSQHSPKLSSNQIAITLDGRSDPNANGDICRTEYLFPGNDSLLEVKALHSGVDCKCLLHGLYISRISFAGTNKR